MNWTFNSFSGEIHDDAGALIATVELMQLTHGPLLATAPELLKIAKDYPEMYGLQDEIAHAAATVSKAEGYQDHMIYCQIAETGKCTCK